MTLLYNVGQNFTSEYDETSDSEYATDEFFVDSSFEEIVNAFNIYYTPILVLLGCTGNFISIIVFYKSKLRVQSTSQYLTGLALSDTLFLCQLLPPWLNTMEVSTLFARNGFCQLFVYLSYVTSNHSAWLVVAFTVERFVAVVYPLRRNAMCTVKRARLIIASLAVVSLVINLPVLRFAVSHSNECNIDRDLIEHAAWFNIFDTMFSFTLPLAIIVFLNAWIMARVYRMNRARGDLMREQQGTRPTSGLDTMGRIARPDGPTSQQRVTRMLLIVSTAFVFFNLPAYSMRIYAYAHNMNQNEYTGNWATFQQIFLLLFHSNFGINFLLYCVSGQNFRDALFETFPCFGRRDRTVTAQCNTCHRQPRVSSNSSGQTSVVASVDDLFDSYIMSCQTDAPSHCTDTTSPPHRRRGHSADSPVIQRWIFDNSRQARREDYYCSSRNDAIELGLMCETRERRASFVPYGAGMTLPYRTN